MEKAAVNPFDYYLQVYGIDSFVIPTSAPTATAGILSPSAAGPQPWIVFTSSLTTAEFHSYREMFAKITRAMGLKPHEFALSLQDLPPPVSNETRVRVAFGGDEQGWQETSGLQKHLVVSSLQDMAQNPELKKSAWSFLKQAMDHRRIDQGRAF